MAKWRNARRLIRDLSEIDRAKESTISWKASANAHINTRSFDKRALTLLQIVIYYYRHQNGIDRIVVCICKWCERENAFECNTTVASSLQLTVRKVVELVFVACEYRYIATAFARGNINDHIEWHKWFSANESMNFFMSKFIAFTSTYHSILMCRMPTNRHAESHFWIKFDSCFGCFFCFISVNMVSKVRTTLFFKGNLRDLNQNRTGARHQITATAAYISAV